MIAKFCKKLTQYFLIFRNQNSFPILHRIIVQHRRRFQNDSEFYPFPNSLNRVIVPRCLQEYFSQLISQCRKRFFFFFVEKFSSKTNGITSSSIPAPVSVTMNFIPELSSIFDVEIVLQFELSIDSIAFVIKFSINSIVIRIFTHTNLRFGSALRIKSILPFAELKTSGPHRK